jgi:ABC-type branched-subunit amino acid transport system ATPase component
MISSLHIEGYRGFSQLDMADIGQVNLIVGKNNSGKTSVLEALHLLTSRGDISALWQLLTRRGERFAAPQDPQRPQQEMDVSHLFTGHELHVGSKFKLRTKNDIPETSIVFEVVELTPKEQEELFGVGSDDVPVPFQRLVLEISGKPLPLVPRIQLSRQGGITPDFINSPRRASRRMAGDFIPVQYIATESLNWTELIGLWNKIQLTPHEDLILSALRFLDSDLERVGALVPVQPFFQPTPRGGFIITRKNHSQPIPIGSMGDGMWRMLSMAIAITQSKGGMLLVDEIDTGLHYTAMADMWRLIFAAAKEFQVQVFATTHSYDCVHSLATICTEEIEPDHRVSIQRIEAGKRKAIPYDETEIRLAAERKIEVR